ncbi:MAG TPA: amino acid adenylation domain-containing protein [Longimicrobium sp.]|nr:non-ribosomal peptide synthetase [Longimicrobium sp.]HSU14720.1 amino acid adenylation domain-containing protein [Longimicrobium sp.]
MTDVVNPLTELSPERRRLLELRMRARQAQAAGPELRPVARPDGVAPLSASQARLWVMERMETGGNAYNASFAVRIRGPLDVAALRGALDAVVARHETLRTTFAERDGVPVQIVHPPAPFPLATLDLSHLPGEEREAELMRRGNEDARAGFDVVAGPVFRVTLVRLGEEEHALFVAMHHLVTDGWSLGVLARDLGAAYAALREGRAPDLPPLPVQYADFAAWEHERLRGAELERLVAYWRGALEGAPAAIDLPTDHPRPAQASHRGGRVYARIHPALAARLRELAQGEEATLFHVLLAAFRLVLARHAGEEDVVIGTPVANRPRSALEGLIGFFIDTVPLRARVRPEATFRELVRAEKAAAMAAFSHSGLPFDRLVEELRLPRDPARNPVFQAALNLQSARVDLLRLAGAEVTPLDTEHGSTPFELALDNWPDDDGGVTVHAEYADAVYARETVERIAAHVVQVLEHGASSPDTRLAEMPLASAEEMARVAEWGRGGEGLPAPETLHGMIAARAAARPDAPALAWDGGALGYAEVEARTDVLARRLRALGVGPETVVGMMLPSSPEGILAILGILKAGGAYVPLDPGFPDARIAHALGDSGAVAVVARPADAARVAPLPVIPIDSIEWFETGNGDADRDGDADLPRFAAGPDNLAYIIYTSGSTGMPKGVAVSHAGAVAHAHASVRAYGFRADSRCLLFASLTFDGSVEQIFATCAAGGCVIPRGPEVPGPAELAERVERLGVNIALLPTGYWTQLTHDTTALAAVKRQLRVVIAGGEEMRADALRRWESTPGEARLINGYGPTEIVVVAAAFAVPRGFAATNPARVPLGLPLLGRELRVLDAERHPVPAGVPGELFIGGAIMARGYHGGPALTAERFVPDPFSGVPGARMYRTGDRVRWFEEVRECGSAEVRGFGGAEGSEREACTDALTHSRTPALPHFRTGVLEFLGRGDAQVKVRGFRVEPGEIEAALRTHPNVAECVVAARPDAAGVLRLAAYFVPRGAAPSGGELRAHLATRVPEYMLPTAYMALDAIPLSAAGKVDRRALPDPGAGDAEAFAAPETPDEAALAAIWAELLGVERVGVEDDFVSLGGHSLLGIRVVSRVAARLGVELPLRAVFEAPTVRALARRVAEARVESEGAPAGIIPPADRAAPLPASFAQERMWFLQQLDPRSPAYNVALALRLSGALDGNALHRALAEIVRRHEVLRTVFREQGTGDRGQGTEGIEQIVLGADAFGWEMLDLSHLPKSQADAEAKRRAGDEAAAPFDLARGPVLRAVLMRISDGEHVLSLVMHHAVSDAWSWEVMERELATLYAAFRRGEPSPLPPLPVQYADFAAWQRGWLRGEALERQAAFWRQRLAGAPAVLELPSDRPRPPVQDLRGALLPFRLSGDAADGVRALAAAEGATPFMVLLAAFSVVLQRWSGQDDLVVGTPVLSRPRPELEPLIGFFSNTLPVRADLSGRPAFRELLRRVRQTTLDAFAHQDLPFERMVDEVRAERSLSHTPLFQVMLALQHGGHAGLALQGVTAGEVEIAHGTSRYDLTVMLAQGADGSFTGQAELATALWDESTIARMMRHLDAVVRAAAADPDAPVATLPLLDADERAAVTDAVNRTERGWDAALVHDLVSAQAARTPDALAVEFAGERVTYAELEARANRLAHRLVRLGVRPDARVAVAMERSVEMTVAVLAVLKAGAGYVAVDPNYPTERIAYMLGDSRAAVVLTTSPVAARLPATDAAVVRVDAEDLAAEPTDAPRVHLHPDNLLYVLYTSGSTGRPKGAALPHRALANVVRWQAERFGDAAPARTLQFASLSFDVSFQEIFSTWASGGALVLIDDDTRRDAEALTAYLREHRIERLFLPFAALQNVAEAADAGDARLPDLREIITAGEALRSTPQLRAFFRANPQATLDNHYGPSETHVISAHMVDGDPEAWPALPPIGAPVANTRLYVLDAVMQPAPLGVPGELFAGGANLARGYLARPALTAEKFVPDPFGAPGSRLYRTGDRVRWMCESENPALPHPTLAPPVAGPANPVPPPGSFGGGTGEERARERAAGGAEARPDSSRDESTFALSHSRTFAPSLALEYVGRTDFQLKIRGFRVEPGEVEAVLTEHPAVVQAAVTARGDGAERRLAAYVVPAAGASPSLPELRAHVAARLPEHMVPRAWRLMDALPLTPSGKVDRRSLPEPDAAPEEEARVAPRTPAEELVADAWEAVLHTRPGAHDDFFALGGHSLAATQVIARIRRAFGIELPLRALFEAPTVAGLAARAAEARRGTHLHLPPLVPVERGAGSPLSFAQQRFWFVERMGAAGAAYNIPIVLTLRGELDADALRAALDGLVARHESLRTSFRGQGTGDGGQGGPVQVVAPASPVDLHLHDLTAFMGNGDAEMERITRAEAAAPFDLERGPLMRARLVRRSPDEHRLILNFHHIVCDAWSLAVAFRELGELYAAARERRPARLAPLAVQYADYAVWQRERLTGQALARELDAWRARLEGAAVLNLPTDRPRPAVQSFRGAILPFALGAETAGRVRELARREGATPFMVLLAAFDVLLSRWTGTEDVVVGSPVAGRVPEETEALVGVFVNTLALRTDLSGDPTFREVLGRVREGTLDAYAHQEVPFERLVEELKLGRSLDRHPLFQVIFSMHAGGYGAPDLPGLSVSTDEMDNGTAKVDLVLGLTDAGDVIEGAFQYASDLFDQATIRRMATHLATLLDAALANPATPIAALPLMPADEEARLESFHGAVADYPRGLTLPALFEAQVARTPKADAVRWNGAAVTYQELNANANRLAHRLRALGVGPEVRVAVCMERTPELIAALLAVHKAGGGYVPIDPNYPADRIAYMLDDSGAPVLLAHARIAERLPSHAAATVRVDADWAEIQREMPENPGVSIDPRNLAYAIYTSGSTGRPKGVQIEHRSAVTLMHWLREHVSDDERRAVLGSTSISFDVSIAEIFGTLCWGGTLVLVRDALALPDAGEDVILASMAPSAAAELLRMRAIPPTLRVLNLGGEALPNALAQGLYALGTVERVGNFYGPTEDTTYSTWSIVERGGSRVYVGRPVANTRAYVLDRHLRRVPVGVPGELYLAGDGLARGYHDRPALTAERFIPDPFSAVPGGRMYRVGDLVRWKDESAEVRECGSALDPRENARTDALTHSRTSSPATAVLDYLGRLDHQVKIRGHRVETGEIEATLAGHPRVRESAVIAREDTPGDARLVAYVVAVDAASPPAPAELREHLKARLPEYMVPAAWVPMDALPLNPNGKVDRLRLPAPGERERVQTETAPRTAAEQAIARVWREVLGVEHVGVDENFFEIGGHSLLLARLQERLNEEMGSALTFVDLFQFTTIAALAGHLAPRAMENSDTDLEETQAPSEARGRGASRRELMRRGRR